MADDKTTESRPVEPINVTVIGTGDGSKLPPLLEAKTSGAHQPDFIVSVVPPIAAISIRFVNLFLTTFVGLVVASMTPAGGKLLYTSDFYHLAVTCASLAVPGAALGFFKDLVTVFGKLEQKFPLATGSV